MKNPITFFSSVILNIATFLIILLTPATVFAWGDNSGNPDGRPEYTKEQINNGALGDTITFNSIKDSVIGHEFNFVGAREDTGVNAGADNVWNGNEIAVEDGKTYMVRMYVHNNNPRGRDAVATNTHVSFSVPSSSDSNNQIQVVGFINSPDAAPTEYWDHVNFKSEHPFHLEYVSHSASLENNGIGSKTNNGGKAGGVQLSDDIVNAAKGGILIGYNKLDGNMPGCYQYDCYIGIIVKVVYDYEYTLQTSVRPAGTEGKNWTDLLEVNVGDEVEYQIEYKNTSNENQYNVMIRDMLPNNMEYIPESTRLWNAKYTGATIDQDDIVTEKGINIGGYTPNSNAIIRINAKVVDKELTEGSNTLVNWGHCTVGKTVVQDYAGVVLYKDTRFTNTVIILTFLIMVCLLIISALLGKIREDKRM